MKTARATEPAAPGYRPEIDGLRAIAVLAVICFHARVPGFLGGFVGVDVFFVISGYLITQLILRDLEADRFSLLQFYERRIRRLMPALFAMLAVATVAASMLLPGDLKRFADSLVAVVAFVSNFLFSVGGNYFEPPFDARALLHTWSLAVEEQFYLLFPLLLIATRRWSRRALSLAFLVLAALSFAFSVWAVWRHPLLAFYFPASRAWELLLGALLAAGLVPRPANRIAGEIAGAGGLLLIGYGILVYTPITGYPGFNALAPCLGTVLIIWSTQRPETAVARLLSLRPLVVTGLASYSLYLWHWPLIVFGTYYALDAEQLRIGRIAMALLTLPVGYLSWRFVELPFRGPRSAVSRRPLFIAAAAASAAFACIGLAGVLLNGLPQRFDGQTQRLAAMQFPTRGDCTGQKARGATGRQCLFGDRRIRPSVVLWGDSHAAMYAAALGEIARRHAVSGYLVDVVGCPPLLDIRLTDPVQARCNAGSEVVLRQIAAWHPRAVILASRWAPYVEGTDLMGRPVAGQLVERITWYGAGSGDAARALRAALEATVARLRKTGATVYFVTGIPEIALPPGGVLAKAHILGTRPRLEPSVAEYGAHMTGVNAAVRDLEQSGLVRVINPQHLLCDKARCHVSDGDRLFYSDTNHLSLTGAQMTMPAFEPVIRGLAPGDSFAD